MKMPWTSDFKITHGNQTRADVLDSYEGRDTSAACNKAFTKLIADCQEKDLFTFNL